MSAATPPLTSGRREANYTLQRFQLELTPAQSRRIRHKANRAARVESGRKLTPRQARWAGILRVRAARKAGRAL